jgi:hypothetical protein
MIKNADVIHCQSAGMFRVLNYFHEHSIKKPLILESPVLHSSTGTLKAATNMAKSYETVPDNRLIQAFLDTFCFTPTWTQTTLDRIEEKKEKNEIFVIGSKDDAVSGTRGYEKYFNVILENGKHAKIFEGKNEESFSDIEEFIANYHIR